MKLPASLDKHPSVVAARAAPVRVVCKCGWYGTVDELTGAQRRSCPRCTRLVGAAVGQETAKPAHGTGKKTTLKTGVVAMTKPERAFHAELRVLVESGVLAWAGFECMKFVVGTDTCWFVPDFMVLDARGQLYAFDCKAWRKNTEEVNAEEDSVVKIKAAAKSYPMIRWAQTWVADGRRGYRWFGEEVKDFGVCV